MKKSKFIQIPVKDASSIINCVNQTYNTNYTTQSNGERTHSEKTIKNREKEEKSIENVQPFDSELKSEDKYKWTTNEYYSKLSKSQTIEIWQNPRNNEKFKEDGIPVLLSKSISDYLDNLLEDKLYFDDNDISTKTFFDHYFNFEKENNTDRFTIESPNDDDESYVSCIYSIAKNDEIDTDRYYSIMEKQVTRFISRLIGTFSIDIIGAFFYLFDFSIDEFYEKIGKYTFLLKDAWYLNSLNIEKLFLLETLIFFNKSKEKLEEIIKNINYDLTKALSNKYTAPTLREYKSLLHAFKMLVKNGPYILEKHIRKIEEYYEYVFGHELTNDPDLVEIGYDTEDTEFVEKQEEVKEDEEEDGVEAEKENLYENDEFDEKTEFEKFEEKNEFTEYEPESTATIQGRRHRCVGIGCAYCKKSKITIESKKNKKKQENESFSSESSESENSDSEIFDGIYTDSEIFGEKNDHSEIFDEISVDSEIFDETSEDSEIFDGEIVNQTNKLDINQ